MRSEMFPARARNFLSQQVLGTGSLVEVSKFVAVGLASALVYAAVIYGLVSFLGWAWSAATLPAYLASMVLNYTLQRVWTFRSKKLHRESLPRYLFMHAVSASINFGMLAGFEAMLLPELIGQIAAIAVIIVWSYVVQKLWVF